MNSSSTWTSRVRAMDWSCSGVNMLMSPSSSEASLRLVQKTSGLFDNDKAGNGPVAGKASKPGLDLLMMDSDPMPVSGEFLGDLLQTPVELMEGDYLDSFMDLSNFLNPEELKETDAVVELKGAEMTEEFTDFSDLTSLIAAEPIVVEAVEPTTTSTRSPRKRTHAETVETILTLSDHMTAADGVVYDHDYVSKKQKRSVGEERSTPVASTSNAATPAKTKGKYRERRDKNNIASRRSRQLRKQKFADMDQEAERLTESNEKLRKKIEELESLAKVMKAELIKKMTAK